MFASFGRTATQKNRHKRKCHRRLRLRAPRFERLEQRRLLSASPYGVMPDDTGEFMLGDVTVSVVLMESNDNIGHQNDNSENWTTASINAVKVKVEEGLQWWVDTLGQITDKHQLNFNIDYTYADSPVATSYEPINNKSTAFTSWVYDFLIPAGFNKHGNYSADIRAFNHAQREKHNTDWAFTIFVVNDENDLATDLTRPGMFEPGGFDRAFAFSGGRCFITPAGRPASTFAHESGHMFWALDEYSGISHTLRRGYYNTQNYNAASNPALQNSGGQQPSIMTSGSLLDQAYANHISSQSSLEMIGWRDGDGDGVFDVLDVPLTLNGTGRYDPIQGNYRFVGESSIQTYPNINSSGLQNDITINEVSRVQYRVDGGIWQTSTEYHQHSASLDVSIPLAAGSGIEIRTVDDVTGITSPVFVGTTDRSTSTGFPGINGFVWKDDNTDGQWDANESALGGAQIQLIDANGDPLDLRKSIEPDDHTDDSTLLNNVIPEVTLSAQGIGVADNSVTARTVAATSTGNRAFALFAKPAGGLNHSGFTEEWTSTTRQLRMDFSSPVTTVSIDAVGNSAGDIGRLEIYDTNDQLLARYTTGSLSAGTVETMTLSRATADIAYAVARSHGTDATDSLQNRILLDNLQFGPESAVHSDSYGSYAFAYLEPGDYTVQIVAGANQTVTAPVTGKRSVPLSQGEVVTQTDFGIKSSVSVWQNQANPYDVNRDGFVSPIDALQVINDLNTRGARELTAADPPPPPYVDVSGDGYVAPGDVLLVINKINGDSDGEAESSGFVAGGQPTGGGPEAEHSESTSRGVDPHPGKSTSVPLSPRVLLAHNTYQPSRSERVSSGDQEMPESPEIRHLPPNDLASSPRPDAVPADARSTPTNLPLEAALEEMAADISRAWLSFG